ncbi:hypothetical protein D3C71_1686660 [compost metagenome]
MADVDQPGVARLQRGVVQTQLLHHAGLEVFTDDVGRIDQAQGGFDAFGLLQVQRNALLVAVEHGKEARAGTQQAAGGVAAYRLDLDHFRAQVREQHAAGRPHHHVGELDDADAFIRKAGRCTASHVGCTLVAIRGKRTPLAGLGLAAGN